MIKMVNLGATCHFISEEPALQLGIKTKELGMAFPFMHLIGKGRIHVHDYVDHEDFYVSPLS